eukprot:GHVU01025350.1.p3 GENE.GHVU01025350.1~~GHVU01025350.1.p3  ORF type:complete len:110 (+),score=23.45 GHVU01025350.1:443-772(+)
MGGGICEPPNSDAHLRGWLAAKKDLFAAATSWLVWLAAAWSGQAAAYRISLLGVLLSPPARQAAHSSRPPLLLPISSSSSSSSSSAAALGKRVDSPAETVACPPLLHSM